MTRWSDDFHPRRSNCLELMQPLSPSSWQPCEAGSLAAVRSGHSSAASVLFGDIIVTIDVIFWQGVRGDVPQLLIEGAEGPEFLQLVRFSGLWQHKVDDHVAWREKRKSCSMRSSLVLGKSSKDS